MCHHAPCVCVCVRVHGGEPENEARLALFSLLKATKTKMHELTKRAVFGKSLTITFLKERRQREMIRNMHKTLLWLANTRCHFKTYLHFSENSG